MNETTTVRIPNNEAAGREVPRIIYPLHCPENAPIRREMYKALSRGEKFQDNGISLEVTGDCLTVTMKSGRASRELEMYAKTIE